MGIITRAAGFYATKRARVRNDAGALKIEHRTPGHGKFGASHTITGPLAATLWSLYRA